MIRVRKDDENDCKITHCMSRMGSYRFPRSLNVTNLKEYKEHPLAPEGHSSEGLIQRLTRRAIFFHQFMSKHQGRNHKVISHAELEIPDDAIIHVKSTSEDGKKGRKDDEKKK
jgi:hypothetical protein